MDKTLIITGGKVNEQFISEEAKKEYDKIIAVDKGLEIVNKLNIPVKHIIGDFDSVSLNVLDEYKKNVIIHKLNPEKDYTDTHMALKLAIKLKSKDITIVGGIGTRIDHVLRKYTYYERSNGKQYTLQIIR